MESLDSNRGSYPRPQLRRRDWCSLNGPWRFTYDDELQCRVPDDIADWRYEIEVPFAPESKRSGIHDTTFHRACWYERDFALAPSPLDSAGSPSECTILHFGAVDYHAQVWVNGEFVAEHEGGHTPFSADISYALRPGTLQRVTVRVMDDPFDLEKPRGKQDWRLKPHAIWYARTTGIWQTVWLERIPATHVASLRWTANLERWEIALHAVTTGSLADELRLSVTLRVGSNVLASDEYGVVHGEVHRRISLSDPGVDDFRNELLWSPERPTLIQAHLQLKCNGIVLDEVFSYTALRSISMQREKILLNGRSYGLRLVLDQGYWPDTLDDGPLR